MAPPRRIGLQRGIAITMPFRALGEERKQHERLSGKPDLPQSRVNELSKLGEAELLEYARSNQTNTTDPNEFAIQESVDPIVRVAIEKLVATVGALAHKVDNAVDALQSQVNESANRDKAIREEKEAFESSLSAAISSLRDKIDSLENDFADLRSRGTTVQTQALSQREESERRNRHVSVPQLIGRKVGNSAPSPSPVYRDRSPIRDKVVTQQPSRASTTIDKGNTESETDRLLRSLRDLIGAKQI
jgi:hypothetical protein